VVAAHAGGRRLQGVALQRGQRIKRGFELGLREFQRRHAGGVQAIEARGVVQQRRIAARADIGQDVGHALLDGRILVGGPMQAGRKICFKTGTSA